MGQSDKLEMVTMMMVVLIMGGGEQERERTVALGETTARPTAEGNQPSGAPPGPGAPPGAGAPATKSR